MMVDLATHQATWPTSSASGPWLRRASFVSTLSGVLRPWARLPTVRARSTSASLCSSSALSSVASGSISRESHLKACGRAGADGAERAAQAAQRLEAEANLHQHCADNADEQDAQRQDSRRSKLCRSSWISRRSPATA